MIKEQKKYLSYALLLLSCSYLAACIPTNKEPVVEAPPPVVKTITYSAAKIVDAPKNDVRFAQTALKQLGFRIGFIDGLWGPRSAQAIRQFEIQTDITSAGGHLSDLNLHWLERMTLLSRSNFKANGESPQQVVTQKTGISDQLKEAAPLAQGPQLIIVNREYTVLSKPNPYSSTLTRIDAGTGLYVINQQDGWFEVESIDRKRGFLPVD